MPDDPDDRQAGRDLPKEVIRQVCAHLDQLSGGPIDMAVRAGIELLIDTGRRPIEIASLPWDCLSTDTDGKPVLIYDNHKANRLGRRLPIAAATATVITDQQQRVREHFPDTPLARLKLLPSPLRNPDGDRSISADTISRRHRAYVDSLPELLVPTVIEVEGKPLTQMLPFDKSRALLYAYRHTYAQRHADAGVRVDVLCQLMDHVEMSTTQQYYRVGEERRRETVDRVAAMQFDRHGNRIRRDAKALLDSEHVRRAIGEVAVPYGVCTEPANVATDGQDCPIRFRCVGCGHFRTDISHLPDLETYLADLLRNRERLAAALDADDWAKREAMLSDEEITRVRRLISRVKAGLDDLSTEERAQVQDAVATARRARSSVVALGLPRVRQSQIDMREDRDDPGTARRFSTAPPTGDQGDQRRHAHRRRAERVRHRPRRRRRPHLPLPTPRPAHPTAHRRGRARSQPGWDPYGQPGLTSSRPGRCARASQTASRPHPTTGEEAVRTARRAGLARVRTRRPRRRRPAQATHHRTRTDRCRPDRPLRGDRAGIRRCPRHQQGTDDATQRPEQEPTMSCSVT